MGVFGQALCISVNSYANANDICSNNEDFKLIVNNEEGCEEGNNITATPEFKNSCNYNKASVWYWFEIGQAGDYSIKINNATFNDVLTVYEDCTGTTEIACTNADEFGFEGEQLLLSLSAGDYYVMVSGADCTFGRTLGYFCIEVKVETDPTSTPNNQEYSMAEIINLASSTCSITGSNLNASIADPRPSCSLFAGASVWYEIQNASNNLVLSTAPNFSDVITLYSVVDGNLDEIACKKNKVNDTGPMIIVLPPSLTYYLQVTGSFATIEADFDNDLCGDPASSTDDDFYIEIETNVACINYNGMLCNDNNPATINDQWDDCVCTGTCDYTGTICDDGNPATSNDYWNMYCDCVGDCDINFSDCAVGETFNTNNCECECLVTINACTPAEYLEGCECISCPQEETSCDDGDIHTQNDMWDGLCNCIGQCIPLIVPNPETINGCPNEEYAINEFCQCECIKVGRTCSDGSDCTTNDIYDDECNCSGVIDEITLDIKILLEGSYDITAGTMTTALNVRGILPGQTPQNALVVPTPPRQPYNIAPWNYEGIEGEFWTDLSYKGDEVDWVLVSFRTAIEKSTEVAIAAGVLIENGNIRFLDCAFPRALTTEPVYIVVEHRNHMGIMSPNPIEIIDAVLSYDFTASDSYKDATSFGQKQISPGIWAMYGGDGDQVIDEISYDISSPDKTLWTMGNGIFDIYSSVDYKMDGEISGADKVLWDVNNGVSSRVPKE